MRGLAVWQSNKRMHRTVTPLAVARVAPAGDAQRYPDYRMKPNPVWLLTLLLGLGTFSGCSETFHSSYPDKAAAIQDGAIARGWVPAWLPESALAIRETHNLDTNETWREFELPATEILELDHSCSSLSRPPSLPRRAPGWWPATLSGDEHRFYRCHDDDGFDAYLAWKPEVHKGYFWRSRFGAAG